MTEQTPSIAKESTAGEELHPGPNDVLLGRGASIIMYEGNVKFRVVVKNNKERYNRTRKRMEKEQIAKEIMDVIASRNGRFLQRIPSSSSSHTTPRQRDCWRIASHNAVMEKIKQALRDRRPSYQNRPEKDPRRDVRKRKKSQLPNPQRPGSETKPSQGGPFSDSQYFPRREMYSRSEMEMLSRGQLPNSHQEMQLRSETPRRGPPEMQYVPLDELLARNRMAMLLRGERSTPLLDRPLFDDPQVALRRLRHQMREQELSVDLLQNQLQLRQGEEAAIPPRYEFPSTMPRLDPGDPVVHGDPSSGADPRLAQQSTRDLVAMLQDQDHRITMQLERLARLRQYEDDDARRYEDDRP